MPTSRFRQGSVRFAARACSAVWLGLPCLTVLTGCVGGPPPPVIDTSMPVVIDYREHLIANPPAHRAQGRVDPTPTGQGRERRFGPEARLLEGLGHMSLAGALEGFRRREPLGAAAFLGLARKKPAAKARQDPDMSDPSIDGEDRTGSIDQRPLDAAAPDAPAPDAHSDREARLDPDAIKDVDGGYKLNFDEADIKDVLQAVLGGVLHMSYTLAPNIMGKLTIFSAAPQDRIELLSTLESVLAMQGLSMTPTANGYRIAPAVPGAGSIDSNGKTPGFGISVVPLQYSSSASVLKLITGFLSDEVRIDAARNTIIVRGPSPRRAEIVRAIKSLDTDWMRSQSVSVVELRRSNPEEIVGELTHIFDTEKDAGGATGSIQFKPIKRLRAIMVTSRNPQLVRRATAWIRRLDHLDVSAMPGIYVYRPRYREARELVRLIKGLFGASGGGSNGGGDVAYQNAGPSTPGPGQGQSLNGSIGQSSASFAGGLSSGAFGASGGSGQGGGGGGNASGAFGTSSAGGGGSAQAAAGGFGAPGLGGSLAEPIEAGREGGGGDKGKLSLTADTGNNSIVAYTDGETYAKVSAVLRQLDLPPLQVAINVTVAEVDLNDALKYGVQFYLNNMPGQISLQATAQQGLAIASSVVAAGSSAGAYAAYGGFGGLSGLGTSSSAGTQDIVLSALNAVSKVHVLSNPSIVVMENKPATFEVGNQVPVTTQSATSTIGTNSPTLNQVQYLDTGIILKIIPRIGQKGEVDMDLDQIISSVVPQASGAQSLTPTISKRRVASNISVRSGQSVMLAGLIQDQRQRARAQLPFVGQDISDVLGNSDNAFSRTELVIFIHPTIIRSGGDAAAFVEGHRQKLRTIDLEAPTIVK